MDIFLSIVLTVSSFFAVILIVVIVHELGHYTVARLCGVRVLEFSIGFGQEILGFQRSNGEKWSFRLFPLGGFVRFLGDTQEGIKDLNEEDLKASFVLKNVWQRFCIVFAGPFFNFLLAWLVFFVFFLIFGDIHWKPVIGGFSKESIAQEKGLQIGDEIVEFNGESLKSFNDLRIKMSLNLGESVSLLVLRQGQERLYEIFPQKTIVFDKVQKERKVYVLGIYHDVNQYEHIHYSLFESALRSGDRIYQILSLSLQGLGQIIIGKRSIREFSGPISIARYAGHAVRESILSLVQFMALISVSLGFFNLFPILPLDGGHLASYLVEVFRRKPLNMDYIHKISSIGFFLLFCFMIFVIVNDIRIYFS